MVADPMGTAICSGCGGNGTFVRCRDSDGEDSEWGHQDDCYVTCEECGGHGVVLVPEDL